MFVFFFLYITNANAQGLSELATNAGFNFGAGITIQQYLEKPDSLFKATLNKDFNMYFEGNKMKFKNVQAVRGVFDFSTYDSVLVMAEKNGKQVRGHCLIWHSIGQNPGWLRAGWEGTPKWTRAQLLDIMKVHISTIVSHYKGRIKEWDVVNEGVYLENGHPHGLRTSYWQQIIGDDYIDSAFVWAHRADPSAYLYYNEFGAEGAIASEYAKRDTVYNLMKRLLAKGIPVHGVGLQCHFGNWINAGAISANIKKLGELGLRVSMTEVDMMNTTNLPGNWKALLNAALENYNCNTFVTCGVDDGHSWFGKDCGCLAWDSVMVAKASIYKALSDALKAANPNITAQRLAFASQLPYPQTPVPLVTTGIVYCQGETASTLAATGKKLRWYASPTATIYDLTAPTPSTTVPGTKSYYVSQTLNLIESPRTEIKITVNKKETWYKDEDGDGKGDPAIFVQSCSQPVGYVKEAATAIETTYAESNHISVFPQPFKSTFILKLNGDEKIVKVQVFNLAGAMVETKNNIDSPTLVMGETLQSGMYLLVVHTEKNTYQTKLSKF
jgi:endo-1,4-beta-xylanase